MSLELSRQRLSLSWARLMLLAIMFACGNVLLVQLAHLYPNGGRIFMPIFFFSLVSGYLFGFVPGVVTGLASPLLGYLVSGAPTGMVLYHLEINSVLMAAVSAGVARIRPRPTVLSVASAVMLHQALIVGMKAWALVPWVVIWMSFRTSLPGMVCLVFGGLFAVLFVRQRLLGND